MKNLLLTGSALAMLTLAGCSTPAADAVIIPVAPTPPVARATPVVPTLPEPPVIVTPEIDIPGLTTGNPGADTTNGRAGTDPSKQSDRARGRGRPSSDDKGASRSRGRDRSRT